MAGTVRTLDARHPELGMIHFDDFVALGAEVCVYDQDGDGFGCGDNGTLLDVCVVEAGEEDDGRRDFFLRTLTPEERSARNTRILEKATTLPSLAGFLHKETT